MFEVLFVCFGRRSRLYSSGGQVKVSQPSSISSFLSLLHQPFLFPLTCDGGVDRTCREGRGQTKARGWGGARVETRDYMQAAHACNDEQVPAVGAEGQRGGDSEVKAWRGIGDSARKI